jgi:hypothetical protein
MPADASNERLGRRPRRREKLTLPADLKLKVAHAAKARGVPRATFMRQAIEVAVGRTPKLPVRRRRAEDDRLAHHIHLLTVQLKKLGTNVNQIAKQANSGMVPISLAEARYLVNQLQILQSAAKATLEKVLA